MSYFSIALQTAMEQKGITQSELSRLADIDTGLMSRYVSGKTRPSAQILEKICLSFAEIERAQIATGHLKDELPPSARPLVRVEVSTAEPQRGDVSHHPGRARLPRDLREAFDALEAMAIDNPDLADHIKTLHRMLRS